MFSKNNNTLWIIIGSVITLVLIFYVAQNLKDVDIVIRNAGVAGPIVAVILYGIFSLTPIPAEPLSLFCIFFFGPVVGSIVIWTGGTFAALVEYHFGLHMRKITYIEKAIKKLPFGLNNMPVDSPYFLIFGRLIPGYGSKIISIVAGVHHVPLKKYLWTTAVMNLLGSLLLAFGGFQFLHLFGR